MSKLSVNRAALIAAAILFTMAVVMPTAALAKGSSKPAAKPAPAPVPACEKSKGKAPEKNKHCDGDDDHGKGKGKGKHKDDDGSDDGSGTTTTPPPPAPNPCTPGTASQAGPAPTITPSALPDYMSGTRYTLLIQFCNPADAANVGATTLVNPATGTIFYYYNQATVVDAATGLVEVGFYADNALGVPTGGTADVVVYDVNWAQLIDVPVLVG